MTKTPAQLKTMTENAGDLRDFKEVLAALIDRVTDLEHMVASLNLAQAKLREAVEHDYEPPFDLM